MLIGINTRDYSGYHLRGGNTEAPNRAVEARHNSFFQLTTTSSTLHSSFRMPSKSSEQYEVMYTMRTEFAKKEGHGPGCYGPPRGPWGFGARDFGRAPWMKNISPAERDVFVKCRQKGTSRAAFGGLLGATAMAGIWNAAALGTPLGVVGVLVGGAIGARTSLKVSDIRRELFTELLQLPSDQAPHAAQAREILQTKLPHNTYAQEILKGDGLPTSYRQSTTSTTHLTFL